MPTYQPPSKALQEKSRRDRAAMDKLMPRPGAQPKHAAGTDPDDIKANGLYPHDARKGPRNMSVNESERHMTGRERAQIDASAKQRAREDAAARHQRVFGQELDKADALYGQTTPRERVHNHSEASLRASGVTIIDNK
jgi:hypothetical protein